MNTGTLIRARAPAKLILSGEHAVLYDQPALAMAINRYTETAVRWSTPLHLSFDLLGINYKQKLTLEALKRLKLQLQKDYHAFHHGRLNIRDVLKHPFELTLYTVMNVLERLKHKLPMGIDINTHSNIPIGSGLGSSAACVVSMIKALSQLLELPLNMEDYLRLGIESENLQHGVSSGLDIRMSYHGGAAFYEQGQYQTRQLPDWGLQLIQTGNPEASTGECVATAARFLKEDVSLKRAFGDITRAMDIAIKNNNTQELAELIRENQRLLEAIAVVPDKVKYFIQRVEAQGAVAKICGAGSVYGDAAGIVWVWGDLPLQALCEEFAYEILPVKGDAHGASVF